MNPRLALDLTIDIFGITATGISESSGVPVESISRYRNQKRDLGSLTVFEILRHLPMQAREFFWKIAMSESEGFVFTKLEDGTLLEFPNAPDAFLVYTSPLEPGTYKFQFDFVNNKSHTIITPYLKRRGGLMYCNTKTESRMVAEENVNYGS